MKKRIVFPLFLLLLAGGTAAAQNWQEALKQAATAVGDKATDGKLTQYALPGTWTYSAPGVRFEGEDAAADLGAALLVPAISEQLAKLYLAAGIQPGSSTVTFDREGGFTAAFGKQKLTGSYEYDARSPHRLGTPLRRETREDRRRFGTRLRFRLGTATALPRHQTARTGEGRQQSGRLAGGRFGTAGQL